MISKGVVWEISDLDQHMTLLHRVPTCTLLLDFMQVLVLFLVPLLLGLVWLLDLFSLMRQGALEMKLG